MKRLVIFLIVVLCFSVSTALAREIDTDALCEIINCKPLSRAVFKDKLLLKKFVNPDMTTPEEIELVRNHSREILACLGRLESRGYDLPDSLIIIKNLATMHMVFNDDAVGNRLILLSGNDYEVLKKLRSAIHLPPPVGYAYVYETVDTNSLLSPKLLESQGGENDLCMPGKTYLIRYIALRTDFSMTDKAGDWAKRRDKILSHELVHAYVNALLGTEYYHDLPKWFEEGIALYLAENKPEEISSNDLGGVTYTLKRSLTEEYKNYLLVFEYLSQVKDKDAFNAFLTDSIKNHSVKRPLMALAGVSTFTTALKAAEHWRTIKKVKIACYIFLAILFFGIFWGYEQSQDFGRFILCLFICLAIFTFYFLQHL